MRSTRSRDTTVWRNVDPVYWMPVEYERRRDRGGDAEPPRPVEAGPAAPCFGQAQGPPSRAGLIGSITLHRGAPRKVEMILFVVPCYNEAARWNATYWKRIFQIEGAHWVFVDDGSTDDTASLARTASAEGPAEVISNETNTGKAESVRRGMLHALACTSTARSISGVGFLDADGAFRPEEVERLIEVFRVRTRDHCYEAVWSSRVALSGHNIERSSARHYIGRGLSTLMSLGTLPLPYDTQSGLKLFTVTDDLRSVLHPPFRTRWLFELELLNRIVVKRHTPMRIWEEPITDWADVKGSRITIRESLRILGELLTVKREQRLVARHLAIQDKNLKEK